VVQLNIELNKKELLLSEESSLNNESNSLIERKRIILWTARAKALPDLRLAMVKAGLNQPNAKVFIRDLIKNKEEAKLIALESFNEEINTEFSDEALRVQAVIDAKLRIKNVDVLKITVGDAVKLLKDLVILEQSR